MADKGGVGIELDLDQVPARETGMTAYEFMLSESQERMLMVLRPDREQLARDIFDKWDLDFAGHWADHRYRPHRRSAITGSVEADIPLGAAERPGAAVSPARPVDTREAAEKLNPAEIEDRVGSDRARCARWSPAPICARAPGCGTSTTARSAARR